MNAIGDDQQCHLKDFVKNNHGIRLHWDGALTKWWVVSCVLWCGLQVAWAAESPALLHRISWTETRDSVVLSLTFSKSLPEKYRVTTDRDSEGNRSLLLAFMGAQVSPKPFGEAEPPSWILLHEKKDSVSEPLRIHIMTMREVLFRTQWKDSSFQMVFPNVLWKENPFWKKPWLYVGIGAAVAGSAVLWLTTGKSQGSGTQNIPPPDIELPK